MWKCEECGCLEIAPTLDFCPQCRTARPVAKVSEGTGDEMTGTEHPADGTMSPPVSNDEAPAAPEPESGTQDEASGSADPGSQAIKGKKTGNAKS